MWLAKAVLLIDPTGIETLAEFVPEGSEPDAGRTLRNGRIGLTVGGDTLEWSFGAQFAEVRIHAKTGEIRVPRLTSAFAAGCICNLVTARSQLAGGMT